MMQPLRFLGRTSSSFARNLPSLSASSSSSSGQLLSMTKTHAASLSAVPPAGIHTSTRLSSSKSSLSDSYDLMIKSLTNDPVIESELSDQVNYFIRMFKTNVTDGKMIRGNAVLQTFRLIRPSASEADMTAAAAVGWSIEVTQGSFLIADDIMDGSITRRGRPCWYKEPSVGLMAVNDSLALMNASIRLLNIHVKAHAMFPEIMDLIIQMQYKTILGQSIDTMTSPRHHQQPNLENYTRDKYHAIIKYKTAYYTISYPIRLGLCLAHVTDPLLHSEAEKILLSIGSYFQIQDDFLDCFGDPLITGKIGRDIEEGKCCWPVITAMDKCSPEQRRLLDQNYGVDDEASVVRVKSLYQELGIEQEYRKYEEAEKERLTRDIDAFCNKYGQVPKEVFTNIMDLLFKRKK